MAILPETRRVLKNNGWMNRPHAHLRSLPALAIRHVHARWLIALAVACGAIVIFFPFFWMAITSLKTAPEIQRVPLQVAPDHWLNLTNYIEVFKREPFMRYLLNSAIVSVTSPWPRSTRRCLMPTRT